MKLPWLQKFAFSIAHQPDDIARFVRREADIARAVVLSSQTWMTARAMDVNVGRLLALATAAIESQVESQYA